MKYIAVILSCLLSVSCISGQRISPEKYSPVNIACRPLVLAQKPSVDKRTLPYSRIVVIDARPDTSKVGYWYLGEYRNYVRLCVNGGFGNKVDLFLNSRLKNSLSSSGSNVLACIRKFWATSIDSIGTERNVTRYAKVYCKIEFYAQGDSGYYPLYRYDNVITAPKDRSTDAGQLSEQILMESVDQLFTVPVPAGKRPMSLEEINAFNRSYEKLPILNYSKPNKGIYTKYSQFRNNQPLFPDYVIQREAKADVIYVPGKILQDSIITDAWGYSDGENIFVRLNLNYFPLFRCGNTFDLYGFKTIRNSDPTMVNPLSTGSPAEWLILQGLVSVLQAIESNSKDLRPYQVNLENGTLY